MKSIPVTVYYELERNGREIEVEIQGKVTPASGIQYGYYGWSPAEGPEAIIEKIKIGKAEDHSEMYLNYDALTEAEVAAIEELMFETASEDAYDAMCDAKEDDCE